MMEGKLFSDLEGEFVDRYMKIIRRLKKNKKMLLAVGHYLVMIDKLEKAKQRLPFLRPMFVMYQLNVLDEIEKTINNLDIRKDKVVASVLMLGAELLLRKFTGGKDGG